MILLDTNALLWMDGGHRRARPLRISQAPLYISPVTLLELQILTEAGRLQGRPGAPLAAAADSRWLLDDPPAVRWFETAMDLGWTRDPFDRLLVAHARMRGWRLATADQAILQHLSEAERMEL